MMHIDHIQMQSQFSSSEIAAAILNLELQGIIRAMPGKMYKLS
jgi:DNA processing protein